MIYIKINNDKQFQLNKKMIIFLYLFIFEVIYLYSKKIIQIINYRLILFIWSINI